MAVPPARVHFPGNPWPKGHGVKEAAWTAVLAPDGLRFHLHVETADYDADDERDLPDPGESAWVSRSVWQNYHACSLSPGRIDAPSSGALQ